MPRAFFDTNVLVYAVAAGEGARHERAVEILGGHIAERSAVISAQVLKEFHITATRKLGVEPARARELLLRYCALDLVPSTAELILRAVDTHIVARISFWDAMIVAAAESARCRILYTEDLNHGQVLNGVRIQNPFAGG